MQSRLDVGEGLGGVMRVVYRQLLPCCGDVTSSIIGFERVLGLPVRSNELSTSLRDFIANIPFISDN